ncbi:MAG: trypsin-like peptidase domain-containing protein, partial [Acholeplasmatales bacterium]|nr:trypsin-like peptidase domain-containing protein [Acholeplasmatales bacterium]
DTYDVPVPVEKGDYTVTFILNNGYVYQSVTTSENKVLRPENPKKEYASFIGWATNLDYQELFNFNSKITSNVVLYAKYSYDYVSLFNKASSDVVISNVRVELWKEGSNETKPKALGSGVIVHESNNYYYCLTNNHVVYDSDNNTFIKIVDAYNNEYEGMVLCKDATYDLALIRIHKHQALRVSKIAEYQVYKNELVFAIGEPYGLSNTVTTGYLLGKRTNIPSESTIDQSNITFDIYYSSAPINSGSSGGGLYDSCLNLIGINFASCVNEDNEFVSSETIPSPEVLEFLKKYTNFF